MMVSSHLNQDATTSWHFDLKLHSNMTRQKNLMVVFDKDGAVASDLMFCAVYKVFNATSSNIYRMLEYSEPAPFDMSKSHATIQLQFSTLVSTLPIISVMRT